MGAASAWTITGGVSSLDFDGANNHITTGILECFDLGPLSLSFWANLRTASINDKFFQTNAATGGSVVEISNSASARVRFIRRWTTTNITAAFNSAYVTNQWSHIALTWDGGADGSASVKCVANNRDLTITASTIGGTYLAAGAGNIFQIGQSSSLSPDGAINDIRVYDRILSRTEIAVLSQRIGIAYETIHRRSYKASAAPPASTANNLMLLGVG